jgi:hypothetical protein
MSTADAQAIPQIEPTVQILIEGDWQKSMHPDELTLFDDDPVAESLDTGELRLLPGCEGELGEPVELFLHLYAVKKEDVVRVRNYNDLSRCVRMIRNANDAETFLRLPTSPDSFYLFERERIELDCDAVPAGAGIDARMQVTEKHDGFLVMRCLYVWRTTASLAEKHLVTEYLGRDAFYERLSDQVQAKTAEPEIRYPVFE